VEHVNLLGRVEPLELGHGAAELYLVRRGADQLNGHESAGLPPQVPGFHDEMGDGSGGRVEDRAAHLAAEPVGATHPGAHGELRWHDPPLSRFPATDTWAASPAGEVRGITRQG
jgi:hypothetical protein